MNQEFSREYVEGVLRDLDDNSYLFPQFALKKSNDELKLLGTGGFSSVYEMYNRERPELSFALKVIGTKRHTVSSAEFRNTGRIQWILCQESRFIVRVLEARELVLVFDENDVITEVRDATKEIWEEKEGTWHLQFVLMEKLDELIDKDRFANVRLLREELGTNSGVLKFAFEIGQALAMVHNNKCLHRDIKIENIFWDASEQVYKLGDFGIARHTEDGNAETAAYTDGYGAPEIERKLYDCYNATADIYSFGITLYLLLNDMKFPGSDGYYSKVNVQYSPEFIFPAPVHATEGVTRIIRKMCAYYPQDRYQSMNEVLLDLSKLLDTEDIEISDELIELADNATETYKEEECSDVEQEEPVERPKTRAERKEEQRLVDGLYLEDSVKYFFAVTAILILLFKGLQPDSSMITDRVFFIIPAVALLEALFQRIKEFYLIFGAVIAVLLVVSIYSLGLTVPHIIIILCVLMDCPVLTMAAGVSTGIWIFLEYTGKFAFLDYISKWDCGWILLVVLLLTINRYFYMRMEWEKITYTRAYLGVFIYDTMFFVMTLSGIVLFILQKCNVIVVSDIICRMHFARTGIVSLILLSFLGWWDEFLEENPVIEEGKEEVGDDEFLDK